MGFVEPLPSPHPLFHFLAMRRVVLLCQVLGPDVPPQVKAKRQTDHELKLLKLGAKTNLLFIS
jgi:hypothetical protein